MRALSMFLLSLAPFALVQGCGDDGLGACPDNSDALEARGSQAIKDNCLRCHSTNAMNRNGAPEDKNMDDTTYVRQDAEEIYEEVSEGEMPPSAKLSDDDIAAIRVWLACGAK